MAYISEGSKTKGVEIRSTEKRWGKKGGNGALLSLILIYDIAENKQVKALVLSICHHLYLSLSEDTHTP